MTAPLRLAVVTDAIEPFHTGGKEARYAALLPRLAGHDVEVHVHTMRWWGGRGARPPEVPGIRFHALGRRRDLYTGSRRSIPQAVLFALSTLRMVARRFDVVEADAIPFLPLFPLWLLTRIRRRPLVVTWHEVWGTEYWRRYLGRAGVVAAAIEKLAARLPDHVIAASDGTAQRLRDDLGVDPERVTVVANGVDLSEIDAAPARPDVGEVVCVGRLLAHKNVHLLLDALAGLRDRGRPTTATIVGTGPERERLDAQVERLGLGGLVEIRDPFDAREEVLGMIKGARVLAFPTEREGFGMVALEALACGTPVVTSDHPDNQARHLVVPGVTGDLHAVDAASLGYMLERALATADARRDAARESAGAYDWDALAARLDRALRAA